MVTNLTKEAEKNLNVLKGKFKDKNTSIQEDALISIAESMLIIAEKIGKRFL